VETRVDEEINKAAAGATSGAADALEEMKKRLNM